MYGDVYEGFIENRLGETVRVALQKEGYASSVSTVRLGADPLVREGARSDADELVPIRPQVVTLHLPETERAAYDAIFADDTPWRLRIEVNGTLDFVGPVRKNLSTTSADKYPTEPLPITANCGLGPLQEQDFTDESGTPYTGRRSVIGWLSEILQKVPSGLDLAASSEWFTPEMSGGTCPLEQEYVKGGTYVDDEDGPATCYDVLTDLLGGRLAFITQENGQWRVHQRAQYRFDSIEQWVYPYGWADGDSSPTSSSFTSFVTADRTAFTDRFKGGEQGRNDPRPKTEVTYEHGSAPNIVPPMWRIDPLADNTDEDQGLDLYYDVVFDNQDDVWEEPLQYNEPYNNANRQRAGVSMNIARRYAKAFDSGNATVDSVVGDAYVRMKSGREVNSGQSLRLTVDHLLDRGRVDIDLDEPFEWLGYMQVWIEDDTGTTRYLKRQVQSDASNLVKYENLDPQWVDDPAAYVAFRIPARSINEMKTDEVVTPQVPFKGEVRLAVHCGINAQDEVDDQEDMTWFSSWEMERPQLRPVTTAGEGAEETIATAFVDEGDTWERSVRTGTGPSQVHEGATELATAGELATDWKVAPYSGASPSGLSLAELMAREALYQLHDRREVLRWPVRPEQVAPSLTTTVKMTDGSRYLPVSERHDYKTARREVELVRIRRSNSLSHTLRERRNTDGEGGASSSGTSGSGAGGITWGQLDGKPEGLFSRSGDQDTLTLADTDISDALGYTPANDSPGTGLASESPHALGIADGGVDTPQLASDAVTADEIAALGGDLAFDDGAGAGAVLRGATEALEVRTQADPTTFAKITVGEVEVISGGTESTYKSEVVEIADSLVEYNTDADTDAWGGPYVYRGRKNDGSGSGLPSKGVVWNPADDRWGAADISAEKDSSGENVGSGVVTSTFSPFLQPDRQETVSKRWAFQVMQELQDGWESPGFTPGLLNGSGVSAYEDGQVRTAGLVDINAGQGRTHRAGR